MRRKGRISTIKLEIHRTHSSLSMNFKESLLEIGCLNKKNSYQDLTLRGKENTVSHLIEIMSPDKIFIHLNAQVRPKNRIEDHVFKRQKKKSEIFFRMIVYP